jgi:hypothetical protein
VSFISKIFSAGASTIVDSLGKVIDNVHTSAEEKLQLKATMDAQLQAFQLNMEAAAIQYEGEVSARHKADMTSDSWLSKNIRPLTLGFLIGSTVILAYSTIFGDLTTQQSEMVKPWITLLTTLDVTAVTFYFGSRGWEAVNKIKK